MMIMRIIILSFERIRIVFRKYGEHYIYILVHAYIKTKSFNAQVVGSF